MFFLEGHSLMRRYASAIVERNVQAEGHRGLTSSLPAHFVQKWEQMCLDWDNSPWPKKTVANPFETEVNG